MNIRKAFTMSEALIVLGIVAVLATLSVLAVQNAKPDPDIVMFRKAYKTLHDIVQNLYYDKELYPNATDTLEVSTKGFVDNVYKGKFAEAFLARLNPVSEPESLDSLSVSQRCGINGGLQVCSASSEIAISGSAIKTPTSSFNVGSISTSGLSGTFLLDVSNLPYSVSGNTADGMSWTISDSFADYNATSTPDPLSYVTVYIDGADASNNCSYDSSSCTRPNKFIFEIDHTGKITPRVSASSDAGIDPIACSYLRYPKINKFDKIPKSSSTNTCFSY